MSQGAWGGDATDPTAGGDAFKPPASGDPAPPQTGQDPGSQPFGRPEFSQEPANPSTPGPAHQMPGESGAGQNFAATPSGGFGPGPAFSQDATMPGQGEPRQVTPGSQPPGPEAGQQQGGRTAPSSAFGTTNSSWPDHQATQSWTQPIVPAPPVQQRKRMGTFGILTSAIVLSVLAGGGTALGVLSYQNPQPVPTQTRTAEAVTGGGQTRVIQGSTSAPDWTVTAAHASKSAVSIQVIAARGSGSSGSGVVLDTAGHIVTNNHVVEAGGDQSQILVQVGDRRFAATVVGTDPSSDLAVLKLANPSSDLTPITFADSDKLAVGDPVMAIGNPLGLSGTVTTGIVSALNRPVSTGSGQQAVVTNAIQTSAAINPGNSGGALVNANGELVGINTAIASLGSSQGGQSGNIGIGFAIESNLVKTVTQQIIQKGSANHAWLGVSAEDNTADTKEGTIVGARITQVTKDSPAEKAGLAIGDLVTSISGRPVSSLESLVAVVRAQDIGEEVEVGYIRSGKESSVKVALAESPRVR